MDFGSEEDRFPILAVLVLGRHLFDLPLRAVFKQRREVDESCKGVQGPEAAASHSVVSQALAHGEARRRLHEAAGLGEVCFTTIILHPLGRLLSAVGPRGLRVLADDRFVRGPHGPAR